LLKFLFMIERNDESKRVIFYLGEIEALAKKTFDLSKFYKINVNHNLIESLGDDIQYTAELLEGVTDYLLVHDLIKEIDEKQSRLSNYFITAKGQKVKNIGSYDKYIKSIADAQRIKKTLDISQILVSIIGVIGGFFGAYTFFVNNPKIESLENDLQLTESHVKSVNEQILKYKDLQKSLESDNLRKFDSLQSEINELNKINK
jgi:hypothetical protein